MKTLQLHQLDAIASTAVDEIENHLGRYVEDYEFTEAQAASLGDIIIKFLERNLAEV